MHFIRSMALMQGGSFHAKGPFECLKIPQRSSFSSSGHAWMRHISMYPWSLDVWLISYSFKRSLVALWCYPLFTCAHDCRNGLCGSPRVRLQPKEAEVNGRLFLVMALQGCVVFVGETHGLHPLKLTASSPLQMGQKKTPKRQPSTRKLGQFQGMKRQASTQFAWGIDSFVFFVRLGSTGSRDNSRCRSKLLPFRSI